MKNSLLIILIIFVVVIVISALYSYTRQQIEKNKSEQKNESETRKKLEEVVPLGLRSLNDRPNDTQDPQIHFMYVLPKDGVDKELDINGKITKSVAAFQKWLTGKTGGYTLRADTYKGALDVTFFRLNRTDSIISSHDAYVREEIEAELTAAGFNASNKIYAVYYDGKSNYSCGGASWPPTLLGNVVAMYLYGKPPGSVACNTNELTTSEDSVGYWELAMLHDILHSLGIVASCAPNHTLEGHVSDDPRDLMYAGKLPWEPSIVDLNNDDYFSHNKPNCLNLADSGFIVYNNKQ